MTKGAIVGIVAAIISGTTAISLEFTYDHHYFDVVPESRSETSDGDFNLEGSGTFGDSSSSDSNVPVGDDPSTAVKPDPEPEIVYDSVFTTVLPNTDRFIYRVGNENPFALKYIFKANDTYENCIIDSHVFIDVTPYEGNVVATTDYTNNSENWLESTVQLTGTGLIKMTISTDELREEGTTLTYSVRQPQRETVTEIIPEYTLYLEVENGYNVTEISDLGSRESGSDILLTDVYTDSWNGGAISFRGESGLYGNGFSITCDATSHYDNGFIELYDSATLDHVTIIAKDHNNVYNFDSSDTSNQFNSAVEARSGDVSITNSFIQGGRSALRTRADSLTLKDSILYGGAYANLLISSTSTVILDNVTTAQYVTTTTTGDTGVMGLGVLIEATAPDSTIILRNEFKQYNWISYDDASAYFTYSYEQFGGNLTDLFTEHTDIEDSANELNTGIVAIECSFTFDTSALTSNVEYVELDTSTSGSSWPYNSLSGYTVNGQHDGDFFHDFDPSQADITEYGVVAPTFNMNLTSDANDAGSTFYFNEDTQSVLVTIQKEDEDGYTWIPEPTAVKNGISLDVSVTIDGEDISQGITFKGPEDQDYTVLYEYIDPYNYIHSESGEVVSYPLSYEKTLHISVLIESETVGHAQFSYHSSNGTAYPTKVVTINYKNYVTIDVNDEGYTSGDNVFEWPITDEETGEVTTLYIPSGTTDTISDLVGKLANSWYWYYSLFSSITISDYADGLTTGNVQTYDSSIRSNVDPYNDGGTLFSCGEETKFDVLTPSDDYWSGPYNGSSITFTTHSSSLYIQSHERQYTQSYSELNFNGEFSYTDNAGQIYYYAINYTRTAHIV
ncbi:MAG: hypothetical protein LUC31_00005 [Coprobacillus sp.]|nr:hypothetical protein [Coprobacillus sp.]